MADKIKVVMVKPEEKAYITEIERNLETMQKLVGGYIQAYEPFRDEVAIVCNEEGKLQKLPPNRMVKREDGEIVDIICGTFFICYTPSESETFESLPDEFAEKYLELFENPELFIRTEKGICVIPAE